MELKAGQVDVRVAFDVKHEWNDSPGSPVSLEDAYGRELRRTSMAEIETALRDACEDRTWRKETGTDQGSVLWKVRRLPHDEGGPAPGLELSLRYEGPHLRGGKEALCRISGYELERPEAKQRFEYAVNQLKHYLQEALGIEPWRRLREEDPIRRIVAKACADRVATSTLKVETRYNTLLGVVQMRCAASSNCRMPLYVFYNISRELERDAGALHKAFGHVGKVLRQQAKEADMAHMYGGGAAKYGDARTVFRVAPGAQIQPGQMVAINHDGYAVPASRSGDDIVGRADAVECGSERRYMEVVVRTDPFSGIDRSVDDGPASQWRDVMRGPHRSAGVLVTDDPYAAAEEVDGKQRLRKHKEMWESAARIIADQNPVKVNVQIRLDAGAFGDSLKALEHGAQVLSVSMRRNAAFKALAAALKSVCEGVRAVMRQVDELDALAQHAEPLHAGAPAGGPSNMYVWRALEPQRQALISAERSRRVRVGCAARAVQRREEWRQRNPCQGDLPCELLGCDE